MSLWTWAAASCRGTAHVRSQTRKQDAFSCTVDSNGAGILIAVVSDGAGSASKGGEGAWLACRTFTTFARSYVAKHQSLPSDDDIWNWLHSTRERITSAAENRGLLTRDFAATLICLISSGQETLVAHVGDGCAVMRLAETSEWVAAIWPAHGEYASTTNFITDCPEPRLTISRYTQPVSAIAVFSDGIERLALDFNLMKPHGRFFDSITRPVCSSDHIGKEIGSCEQLEAFLDSAPVNDRTDDDKTIILAARR